jgi:DNA-binding transcriptional LysR family regulator
MDLNEMVVFARVVQTGSFTTAAAELGMPKSTVSRKVTDLEARLKARLLQRTTRKLNLTDVGRIYFEYCARVVAEIEDAERAVNTLQETPRGLLRVTVGVGFGFLGPIISDFLKRCPEVRIELFTTARIVDLVEERFDVGIRAGPLADSSLVARSLGTVKWFLVATPGYLKRRGRPKSPDDLRAHDCLLFGTAQTAPSVRLQREDRSAQFAVSTRLLVGDMDILVGTAVAGLGIALVPAFKCVDDLRAHRLERVLGDWNAPPTPVHAVVPTARHISPKVKAFVDHLQQRMTPPPWETGPLP